MAARIYLDTSVFNRPFDDQGQARIKLETDAFLAILEKIEENMFDLVGSSVLDFETEANPSMERRGRIRSYLDLVKDFMEANVGLRDRAKVLEGLGFKAIDALHLAAAERHADIFLTVDDRLIKKAVSCEDQLGVKVMSPINFILSEEFDNA